MDLKLRVNSSERTCRGRFDRCRREVRV